MVVEVIFTNDANSFLLSSQLGVSSVDELRQILGTDVDDTQKKKLKSVAEKSENGVKDSKGEAAPTDEIVYKDSSTFLKVSANLRGP